MNNKNFSEALQKARLSNKHKDKAEALSGLSEESLKLVWEAYNPYRVYGVKKWESYDHSENDPETFISFFNLLDDLCSRKLTGNAARYAVSNVLSNFTKETALELENVLKKDLRCGASATTFQKLYPQLKIPSFEVMLASKVDEKFKWEFPVLAEMKYDGLRMIAICENGKVTYYSRAGKTLDQFSGLFDEEIQYIEHLYKQPIVLDGEALASSFQETMMAKSDKNNNAKANLKFFVFDFMTLDEWHKQKSDLKQINRSNEIENFVKDLSLKLIEKSEYKICNDYAQCRDFYDKALQRGFEGLIIKNINSYYEWDRSKSWAKWKPVLDFDLKVVGIYEGEGRNSGRLGGFDLEGFDENGKFIRTQVGSGFSDFDRITFWKNPPLNKIVMVEAQELSLAENSDAYSLRFPVFVKVRDDKMEE